MYFDVRTSRSENLEMQCGTYVFMTFPTESNHSCYISLHNQATSHFTLRTDYNFDANDTYKDSFCQIPLLKLISEKQSDSIFQ